MIRALLLNGKVFFKKKERGSMKKGDRSERISVIYSLDIENRIILFYFILLKLSALYSQSEETAEKRDRLPTAKLHAGKC